MWLKQLFKKNVNTNNDHIHVPECCEVFLCAECVQSEEDLNSECSEKAPLSLLQVEANDERIQQNEEVKRIVKVPTGEISCMGYETAKVAIL